jgi:hypothetical protein
MTFQCLANLVMREHVFVFLQMDSSALKRYYSIYDRVLQTHNPKMHSRFKAMEITNEMYLFPWLQVCLCMLWPGRAFCASKSGVLSACASACVHVNSSCCL